MEEQKVSGRSTGSYIAGVAANAVVLYLVNKVPEWDLPFIIDGYEGVLWALNLSVLVQLAGNALLIFFHPRFVHYVAQVIFNLVSLLAIVVLVSVFPFDFSFVAGIINTMTRIALIVAAVGTGISVVVNLFRALGTLVPRAE